MIKTLSPEEQAAPSQDFARLCELQQEHSAVTLSLEKVEQRMSVDSLAAAAAWSADYVVNQERLAELDAEIKALFARHPEWREDGKKSIKTPFGTVEQRTVSGLVVANPAATVALIKARAAQDEKFKAATFLRIEELPNVEALEALGNDELAKLGVTRETTEKVTVKPAKVSAAKVVKAAKPEPTKKQ
jgi:hypothetical protein